MSCRSLSSIDRDRAARDRPTAAGSRRLARHCTRRSPEPSARTRCGSIGSAGRSTRPTPASTRSCRSWSRFPRPRPTSWPSSRCAASSGVPITARGGGTSQAGQSIGPGVILDCSKYFNRVLEINAAERWVRVEPGCVLDDLNRGAQAARPAVRPGHLDRQPGHDRRHDRQQLVRRAVGPLRQDDRPRARAEGRAGRRQRRPPRAARRSRSSRRSAPSTDLEGACYRAIRRLAAEHAERDRAPLPEDPPARRRLQPRRVRSRARAERRRSVQPRPPVRRLGGDARRDRRGQAAAGRAAARQGRARRPVRRPARRAGGDAAHPASTARRRSRWWTGTSSTAPG